MKEKKQEKPFNLHIESLTGDFPSLLLLLSSSLTLL